MNNQWVKTTIIFNFLLLFLTTPAYAVTVNYTYDQIGRVVSTSYTNGAGLGSIGYSYDASGNLLASTTTGVAGAQLDSDGDGVIDAQDAFPNDPAASVDTDGDGQPDAWNVGKTAADSTSVPQLTLDAWPADITRWADTIAPVITLTGGNITVAQGGLFINPGLTVTDNAAADATANVVITGGPVNTAAPVGTVFTLNYNVSDASGNAAVQKSRTVSITAAPVDAGVPVITLNGSATVTVVQGSTYVDAGATAQDVIDGNLTTSITATNMVNTSVIGIYSVKYDVSDSSGNVAIQIVRTVHVISASSIPQVTTIAGGTGIPGYINAQGTAARFTGPYSVAVDSVGNVYIAETNQHIIRKMDVLGNVTTFAGAAGIAGMIDGPAATARFNRPFGIAVDSNDNLYVADTYNHQIRKIDTLGNVTRLAGGSAVAGSVDGRGTFARFYWPMGIAVDAAGNVYVADNGNQIIRKVDPFGRTTTIAGGAGLAGFVDAGGIASRFNSPTGVAVDGSGNVYVSDTNNHRIRKVDLFANVTTFAGGGLGVATNGPGATASFSRPEDVAVDVAGNVYVADSGNHLIRKVDVSGVVTTVAGAALVPGAIDGTGTSARFNGPVGVTTDSLGNVYVADYFNHIVRKVSLPSLSVDITVPVVTLAGGNINLPLGMAFTDPGYSATDDIDGNITSLVTVTGGPVNPDAAVGTVFTLNYNVSDAAGNPAIQKSRTVTITAAADITIPVITLIGGNVTVTQGGVFADPGYSASDNVDGNITANVVVTGGPVNTAAMVGTVFTLNYSVSDAAGNLVVSARSVTIIAATPVDTDGDGVPDALDAFPNDPAASVDTDGDGRPDAWNVGATAAQIAASALTLDVFPKDPNAWASCIQRGIVDRVTVFPGNANSAIYVRKSVTSRVRKTFTTRDEKLLKAAVKSLPGRTYVEVKGNRDCTTATNGGAAQYVDVAP